jgi:hypothetical protein
VHRRTWALVGLAAVVGATAGAASTVLLSSDKGSPPHDSQLGALVPADGALRDMRVLRSNSGSVQVALVWTRAIRDGEAWAEFDLSIWQQDKARWHRLYHRRLAGTKEMGIDDVRLRTTDFTLDGRDDLLVIEDHNGSAGAYVYRVVTTHGGSARQIEARSTSFDQTSVLAEHGALISYDGVGKDPKTLLSIHCCPLYWQRTVKKWNGERLVTVATRRVGARPLRSDY